MESADESTSEEIVSHVITQESTDLVCSRSHDLKTVLLPAIDSLRTALLCQMKNLSQAVADQLDNLLNYLMRLSGVSICEMEPILMWKLKQCEV